jgi:hypothetical protein
MIGNKLAQAYIDDPRHDGEIHRCNARRIMDDHFQRAHDEGVAAARDAFLNMIADAQRFGRTVITCDYHFTVDHSSLEELANALGIRRDILRMENIGDVIWRHIESDNAVAPPPTGAALNNKDEENG